MIRRTHIKHLSLISIIFNKVKLDTIPAKPSTGCAQHQVVWNVEMGATTQEVLELVANSLCVTREVEIWYAISLNLLASIVF